LTPLTDLPVLGYLEQSCSSAIHQSLSGLAQVKPRIPWRSVEQTALIYVGCHLKAFNKAASDYSREKYKKKMEKIEGQSDLLKYLAETMTRRYREPNQRPESFDQKMKEFYDMK